MFELFLTDWMYDLRNPNSRTLQMWHDSVLDVHRGRFWVWPKVMASLKM